MKPLKSDGTTALKVPPFRIPTSRMSPGVPISTGEPPRLASPRSRHRPPGLARSRAQGPVRWARLPRLSRHVHPEKHAARLAELALSDLVLADAFRVPHPAACSDLQERSGPQARTLHRVTWTGAMAGAR